MKADRKPKAEKSPPAVKTVKSRHRTPPKTNGKHALKAYEHIPIGIVEVSLDGRYMDVNEEFCRILGYSRQELLQLGLKDCTHEDDYAIDAKLCEQLITGKIPFYRLEKRYLQKDGGEIWVELTRTLVCDAKGKPHYTMGVVLDISDRKDVERVLRDSVERLRLATGAAQMFMWEWDFQNQSYTLADNFEKVLGFSAGLLPRNRFETIWALSPEEDVRRISDSFEKAVENQTDLSTLPCRVINPENGQIVWLDVSAKIVYDEAGNPVRMFGVAQNITESKNIQNEITVISRMPEENPNPVMRLKPEGKVLYANPAGAALLEDWTQDVQPTIPEELLRTITQAFTSGVKTEVEFGHHEKHFSFSVAPFIDSGYVNLYGKDITQRKQAEAALAEYARQQEALYQLSDQLHRTESLADVYDAALDAILNALQCHRASILLFDDSEVMHFVAWRGLSDAYRQATDGHSPWKPDTKDPQPIVLDDVRTAELSESLRAVIQGEGIGSLAFIPLVSNGALIGKFMVYFNAPHVFDEAEIDLSLTIARQLAAGIDRKRAEEQLRAKEAELEEIINKTPFMLTRCSRDLRYRFVSSAYAEMIGRTPEEVAGKPILEIMGEEGLKTIMPYIEAVLEGKQVEYEVEVPFQGMRIPFLHVVYTPDRDEHRNVIGWFGSIVDISERKHAEEKLRQSEERFRTLANVMPSMVWTAAPDGTITYANDQWFRYVGITPEENARSWPELVLHPDDYERCVREWAHALETVPDEYLIEIRNRRYDGEYRWFQTRAVPVRDASGKARAWYGVTTDIHERIESEKRLALLAEISEMLRNVEDPRELMYMIAEAVGEHLHVKRALFNEIDLEQDREVVHRDYHNGLASVAGVHKVSDYSSITSAEIATGKTVVNSDSKIDPRTAQDYERTYAVSGERAYVAVPLMRANRWVASFWVSDDVPRRWTSEEVSLLETVAERTWAIIEKLRINTALRESEERYRAVVESQAEMLCRFRPDGTILFVNGAYARARGTTPEALASRNFWEFVAEADRPSVKAMLDSLTSEAPQVQIENRFHMMDGERWTLWTNRALSFDAEGHWLEAQSSGIDITERKQVEEALRASEERMRLATDAAGMFAWELDIKDQMFTLSDNFAEVLGFSEELVPENILEAVQRFSPAEDAQTVRQAIARAFEHQENLRDLQYRIVNPENGEVNWVEVNARTIYGRRGKPERMYGVSQNITERKQAENALRIRARQQQAVAKLGELALRERDLQTVFDRATTTIAETLEIEYCKILELLENGEALLLRAGVGWQEKLVGRATVGNGLHSQAGFTLQSNTPVVVDDLRQEQRFHGPPLLLDHGVISGMSCIVPGPDGKPWGVLGAHSTRPTTFTEDDVNFLVAVSNILGDAIFREEAETALARERELLNRIFESIPVMLTIYDPSTKLLRLNRQFEQLIGWSAEEAAGISLMEAIYPDPAYREKIGQFMDRCIENEWMDIQMRARDGRTLETSWSNIRLSNDMRVGIGIDITERKRAENALRESEERYRFIVENTSDGIWWIELTEPMPISLPEEEQIDWYYKHAVIRQCNLGMARMYGYDSVEEVVGLPVRVVMPRENPVNLELSRQFIRSGYRLVDAESREQGRDRRELVFLNNMVGIVEDGKLKGEWGTNRDITERKRAEEALRASESLYRTIARSIPGGGVYVVDKDFRYLVAEGPVTEAFGLTREMVEGHTVTEVFPDERGRRMEERLRRNFAGDSVDFETQFDKRVFWTQMAPLHDSIGQAIIVTLDITERKRAEEALRQSEERFTLFMQHLPGLAWIKDREGRYVYANAAAEKAFNTPREKLYGKTDEEIFPAEVAAQFHRNDAQALTDEKGVQVIETLAHADGVLHSSLVSKFPIPGPDGETALIGGTAFDITERLLAEEALRESEERFRALLNQATAGIVLKDDDGRLIFVNQAFCNMLGRAQEELLGKTIWDFMHKEDITESTRSYERLMLEGIPFKLERRLIRADGSVIWVDASVSPIMDAEGKPQSAVAVEVDITGRKHAEEALQQLNLQLEDRVLSRTAKLREVNQTLREEIAERRKAEKALRKSEAAARENEEKLSTLFRLLPVGISFLDPRGQIIQMNPALANMLKLSEEQLADPSYRSRKYIRANGTLMSPAEFASQRAVAEGKTVYNVETGVVLEDGELVWTSVSAAPVDVADVGAVVVTVDITESKRAEQALQESRERLQILSQRLVEVQEDERRSIARELHDRVGQTLAALNINLIIISGQLGGKVDEQVSTRLNDSMKLVAETIALVRDVMSNLRPSVLDDYGLEAAIESHLSQYMTRYEIQANFEKSASPLPRLGPSVEMTFLRIAQEALMNIAKHARASQVTVRLQNEENVVRMTIQDNGIGIESWSEANRPGSHGLTIMRERAEAFGGSLRLNSIPGNGTKVDVIIPIENSNLPPAQKEMNQ